MHGIFSNLITLNKLNKVSGDFNFWITLLSVEFGTKLFRMSTFSRSPSSSNALSTRVGGLMIFPLLLLIVANAAAVSSESAKVNVVALSLFTVKVPFSAVVVIREGEKCCCSRCGCCRLNLFANTVGS